MPPGDVGPSTGQTTAAIAPAPFGLGRMEDWRVFPIKTTQKIIRNEEADIALHFQKRGDVNSSFYCEWAPAHNGIDGIANS